ncbi:MAG: ABC transporter ATP-binding protein [Solirubrobacterales bacterium]
MSSAASAPIEFDGLVKRFGHRTVLDGLSFTVPEGGVVGLLGPNGAGKSTAMRCLLGLQRPTAGHARILGHEAGSAGFREATRKAGVIIEAPPLYKNVSALVNLEIRVASMGLSINDAQVREILHRVGLADRVDDKVGSFSLGMRQRVGIALALVGDPSIVVLDEPTNGLDPEGAVEVRNLVRELPQRGATTLLCTHRLAEIEATCDYVVLLQAGKLITQGSLEDVIAGATGSGLQIGVAPAELERALQIVAGLGLGETRIEDGAILTSVVPEDPSAVTRALAQAGIYLSELEVRRATLEQAFLALTASDQAEHA